MTIKLDGLGHVALWVGDQKRSREFYTDVLGLQVLEEDPQHGGCFLTTGGDATHVWDMSEIPQFDPKDVPEGVPMPKLGVSHVAFKIASHDALRDAYFNLVDHGMQVHAIDHVTQESIYFMDPDSNTIEIYWERPGAQKMWADGREDKDEPLVFEREVAPS